MAGYKVFTASTGTEALEWAGVLPFSIITLDSMLPGMSGTAIAAGLKRMIRNGLLGNVAIVALTAENSAAEEEAWRNVGVNNILLKPLSESGIISFSEYIKHTEKGFYLARDTSVDIDLLGYASHRLPEMQKELIAQVLELGRLMDGKTLIWQISQQAHAVKSASLSLGFYRLSGLAAAIENALKYESPASFSPNFTLIKECLTLEFNS